MFNDLIIIDNTECLDPDFPVRNWNPVQICDLPVNISNQTQTVPPGCIDNQTGFTFNSETHAESTVLFRMCAYSQ